MESNTELIALCENKAKQWLSPSFDEDTRKAVQAMLDNADKTDLIESFYKDLEFGTGGLRGIMGAGSNRMNIYTVGMATQGFANYLKRILPLAALFLSLFVTTAVITAACLQKQLQIFSRQTELKSIFSMTCVLHRSVPLQYVISVVRQV